MLACVCMLAISANAQTSTPAKATPAVPAIHATKAVPAAKDTTKAKVKKTKVKAPVAVKDSAKVK